VQVREDEREAKYLRRPSGRCPHPPTPNTSLTLGFAAMARVRDCIMRRPAAWAGARAMEGPTRWNAKTEARGNMKAEAL
jgi:hypothetical protein